VLISKGKELVSLHSQTEPGFLRTKFPSSGYHTLSMGWSSIGQLCRDRARADGSTQWRLKGYKGGGVASVGGGHSSVQSFHWLSEQKPLRKEKNRTRCVQKNRSGSSRLVGVVEKIMTDRFPQSHVNCLGILYENTGRQSIWRRIPFLCFWSCFLMLIWHFDGHKH